MQESGVMCIHSVLKYEVLKKIKIKKVTSCGKIIYYLIRVIKVLVAGEKN